MAFYRYEIKTKTWICPSCHHAVKKETKNDAIEAGLALCFPIGIAVWGARGIRKMLIKKELTATGDEIIDCPNCGKKVVVTKDCESKSRLFITEEMLVEIITPVLQELEKEGITSYRAFEITPENSESISYTFRNTSSRKEITLKIYWFDDQLVIRYGDTVLSYSNQNLFSIVCSNLVL